MFGAQGWFPIFNSKSLVYINSGKLWAGNIQGIYCDILSV